MAPNDSREKLTRRPFQPLRIYLSDGSSHEVSDETHATVSLMELTIGVEPDDSGLLRRAIYIDPRHVTRIEPIVPGTTPGGGSTNGN
ncbi:MAG: hypothetical protein AAF612_05850 [Planctomycetota bacterium]